MNNPASGDFSHDKHGENTEDLIHFKFLADAIPQIIWTSLPDGNLDYFNKNWVDYTGLSLEESKGLVIQNIIHPEERALIVEEWTKSVNEGKKFEVEYRLKRFDNIYRWFLVRALPLKDNDGRIVKWFGTNTDIHENKELILNLNDLAEIQKNQKEELKVKNNSLEKINMDLDNFVYTASHDLKAPISNLEGLITVLHNETTKETLEPLTSVIEMMGASINRLKTTINDLADISRVQRNIEEDVETININDFFKEFKENYSELIKLNKAKIFTDFGVNEIKFSKRDFRSLLSNLISNSIKYRSLLKDPEVFIKTEKGGNNLFLLSIKDNGLGIDPNKKDKVFQIFKRLHTHVEGSGIGLYIVKRIVENNSGKIEFDSVVGKGTEFKIFFEASKVIP